MHSLVRQQWKARENGTMLARFRFHGGGMVMAFHAGASGPEWVAKRGDTEASRARLRRERAALEYLLPWQSALRVPRLLAWEEDAAEVCLVMSGIAGVVRMPDLRSNADLDPRFVQAGDWIRGMQHLVPSPRPLSFPEIHEEWLQGAQKLPEKERRSLGLWEHLRKLKAPARQTMTVHGDFWWGNLLFCGDRIGVVDWDGMQPGTPLDDMLTLLFKTLVRRGWTEVDSGTAFRIVFFEHAPCRRFLQQWARECGLTAEDGHFCFYRFLARRLQWELGLDLQVRSEQDQESARRHWSPILGWLAEQNYPNPFKALS